MTSLFALFHSDNRLFLFFVILLIWLPIPLASYPIWAGLLMAVGFFTLLSVWLVQFVRGRVVLSPIFINSHWIVWIWLIWLSYLILQLIPLPITWLEMLSPQAADWYSHSERIYAPISVDVYFSHLGLLHSISYVILFTLTLLLVRNSTRLRWLLIILVLSGVFQALYGSFMVLTGWEYDFFREKVSYRGVVTGTSFNRNTLANYLTLCLAAGIGLLIAQLRDESVNSWRQWWANLLTWLLSGKMRLRLYLVLMVIALVMTHSRMGNTAFFVSLMLAGGIGLLLARHAPRATIILLISLVVIDVFVVGAWFGLEKVAQRLERTSLQTESRDEVSYATLQYWQDYTWTGSGLGSYYNTFLNYQTEAIRGYYILAHNDYLQFLAEVGVIGGIILIVLVGASFIMALAAQYHRRQPLSRGAGFVVVMVIIALSIHSAVDFNLQVPANAATFIVLLALAWVARYLPRSKNHSSKPSQPLNHFSKVLIIGLLILSLSGLYWSATWLVSERLLQMVVWSSKIPVESARMVEKRAWQKDLLQWSHYLNSRDPRVLDALGAVTQQSATPTAYRQALHYYQQAVLLRPMKARTWSRIAKVKHLLNEHDEMFIRALDNGFNLAKWHEDSTQRAVEVGLQAWFDLSRSAQTKVEQGLLRLLAMSGQRADNVVEKTKRKAILCLNEDTTVELKMHFCAIN